MCFLCMSSYIANVELYWQFQTLFEVQIKWNYVLVLDLSPTLLLWYFWNRNPDLKQTGILLLIRVCKHCLYGLLLGGFVNLLEGFRWLVILLCYLPLPNFFYDMVIIVGHLHSTEKWSCFSSASVTTHLWPSSTCSSVIVE